MTQPTVVPSAPGVELSVSGDGRAVGAATGYVHHVLPSLFTVEGRDHRGLLQVPETQEGFVPVKILSTNTKKSYM